MSKQRFAVTAAAVLAAGLGAAPLSAQFGVFDSGEAQETIFYADSLEIGDGASALYDLSFDAATSQAKLSEIIRLDASLGEGRWEHVDTLAATPDGTRLFFVDTGPLSVPNSRLGSYDRGTGELRSIGVLRFSDTGIPPAGLNTTDLASISANGTMYLARVDNDAIYRINLDNADATRVGLVVNQATGATVNLAGGDLAFDHTGRLHVWVNQGIDGAPRGLYRGLDVELPAAGEVGVEYLGGDGGTHNFTGLAFREAGMGDLLASMQPNMFPQVDRQTGATMTIWGYDGLLHGGDLTTGELAFCTHTVADFATQDWNDRTITINGQVIDEQTGKEIFAAATSTNFSGLFAQLIGAKLNCESCGGVLPEAEAFLLESGVFVDTYDAPFAGNRQRDEATDLAARLEAFSSANTCGVAEEVANRGRFTGGGSIRLADGVRVTRGLTLHCDLELSNNLQVNWGRRNRFHMTEHLTTVSCHDDPLIDEFPPDAPVDTLIGVGSGRFNGRAGYTIEFTVKDAGEPGRNDEMAIRIYQTGNPANVVLDTALQRLRGGNLQAHDDQPHR